MQTPSEAITETPPDAPAPAPPAEARQRWRLTFARPALFDRETPTGREYLALWETAIGESGLPAVETDAGRVRLAVGAPLPARTAGRAELIDCWLTERVPAWRVREALDGRLPRGHELIAVEDIWLGAQSLVGRVTGADYRMALPGDIDAAALSRAVEHLLGASRIERVRMKGGALKTYDLRPLLVDLRVEPSGDSARDTVDVVMRVRIHPELGSGRPEDVLAALAEAAGQPLEPLESVRERVLLADDLER